MVPTAAMNAIPMIAMGRLTRSRFMADPFAGGDPDRPSVSRTVAQARYSASEGRTRPAIISRGIGMGDKRFSLAQRQEYWPEGDVLHDPRSHDVRSHRLFIPLWRNRACPTRRRAAVDPAEHATCAECPAQPA